MADSESNQPVERRRADPSQGAAERRARAEDDATATRPAVESRKEGRSRPHPADALARAAASIDEPEETSSSDRDDDSPRARRAAARAARQAAAEKRRAERAAAKASAASR